MWGARGVPVPHLCSPLNISVRVAPPHYKPSPFAYLGVSRAPQKHLPVPWWGETPGLGAQPSPPPPAGKQHLGFQCDSCVLNPIFQMDGGRRAGQVTCLKVMRGQGGEGLAALRGGLVPHSQCDGDSEPHSWAQGVTCGTTTTPPRQAGRQLLWHPKGNACMGCCPTVGRFSLEWHR